MNATVWLSLDATVVAITIMTVAKRKTRKNVTTMLMISYVHAEQHLVFSIMWDLTELS